MVSCQIVGWCWDQKLKVCSSDFFTFQGCYSVDCPASHLRAALAANKSCKSNFLTGNVLLIQATSTYHQVYGIDNTMCGPTRVFC